MNSPQLPLLFEGTRANSSPPGMATPSQLSTDQDTTTPTDSLETAVAELLDLSIQNAPLSTFHSFFKKWEAGSGKSQLQLNALESFNESFSLRLMIEKNRDDVVQCMLSYGFHISNSAMAMALHQAKATCSKTVLEHLFAGGWDINRPVNEYTPPAISLLLAQPEFVQYCLSLGASPNATSPSGNTVMQRAVSYASLDIVKLLVQHGAIIKSTNLLPHVVRAHIETHAQTQDPVFEGRLEVLDYLLDHGALINAFYNDTINANVPSGDKVTYGQMTALHFAIAGGKKDLVQLLLERGADKEIETWSGWKTRGRTVGCVELARICGFEDIAGLLERW